MYKVYEILWSYFVRLQQRSRKTNFYLFEFFFESLMVYCEIANILTGHSFLTSHCLTLYQRLTCINEVVFSCDLRGTG